MLEEGILVAEQSVNWQPKWSYDSQHSTFALTGLNKQSEAQSNQPASCVKPIYLYNCSEYILPVFLVTNEHPTLFILKVQESSIWKSLGMILNYIW